MIRLPLLSDLLRVCIGALILARALWADASQSAFPSGSSASVSDPHIGAEGATVPVEHLVGLALAHNPNREVWEANRAVAAAEVTRARAWSNPELEMSGGRSRARDGGARETIHGLDVRQRLELPGKRSARIKAAESERGVAEREAAVDALDLEAEVRSAALLVAAADAAVMRAEAAAALANEIQVVVEKRLTAGETDQGDVARVRSESAVATLALEAARRAAEAARATLRAWCGEGLPARFTVADALTVEPVSMTAEAARAAALAVHPRLAVLVAQAKARRADILREEKTWYPDVTVGAFADRESDTNNHGLSLGVELPLWNRNQGGIAAARADLSRISAERKRELAALQREVGFAWSACERERLRAEGLGVTVVPAANEALTLRMKAFRAGESSLLEVLDARRAALAAEEALLEARRSAAEARITLAKAMGTFNKPTSTNDVPAKDSQP